MWKDFLRNTKNKIQPFSLLANHALRDSNNKHVVTNVGDVVRSSRQCGTAIAGLSWCSSEEADGRIIAHLKDMVKYGAQFVLICTVDSDVVVLAVSFYSTLKKDGLLNLWIKFGKGKNQSYLPAHTIADSLLDKAIALRGFHSFTGCDTTSAFYGKGKRSAYAVWKSFEDATSAFLDISTPSAGLSQATYATLERFVILLYDKNSESFSIDKARGISFTSKNKTCEQLPPSFGALRHHASRAKYRGGQIWGQADVIDCNIPSPEGWGWIQENNKWEPLWSDLPPISEACRELVKCSCKTGCRTLQCSCKRSKVPCTLMCAHCNLSCQNSRYYR